jgi:hypothetical protein
MKKLSFIYIMILLSVVTFFNNACNKDETVLSYDIKGDWKVTSFVDYTTATVINKTDDNTWNQFNNGDITVSFIENDQTSGVISGRKVTNSFSGNYTIDSKGVIKINNIFQTEINEPEWGRMFDSIVKAESFEIRNDQLKIFYNQRKNCISFERLIK